MFHIVYGEHTGAEAPESRGLSVSIAAAPRPRSDSSIAGGEIDIFEGVNLATRNQMTLHTTSGCTQPQNVTQTGTQVSTNCDYSQIGNSGCTVQDSNTASYGAAFARAGGGVWVTEFAETGINIWFFSVRTLTTSSMFAQLIEFDRIATQCTFSLVHEQRRYFRSWYSIC